MSLFSQTIYSNKNLINKILSNAVSTSSLNKINIHKDIKNYSNISNELKLNPGNINNKIIYRNTPNLSKISKSSYKNKSLLEINSLLSNSFDFASVKSSRRYYSNKSYKKKSIKCKYPDSILFTSESVGEGHPGNNNKFVHLILIFFYSYFDILIC